LIPPRADQHASSAGERPARLQYQAGGGRTRAPCNDGFSWAEARLSGTWPHLPKNEKPCPGEMQLSFTAQFFYTHSLTTFRHLDASCPRSENIAAERPIDSRPNAQLEAAGSRARRPKGCKQRKPDVFPRRLLRVRHVSAVNGSRALAPQSAMHSKPSKWAMSGQPTPWRQSHPSANLMLGASCANGISRKEQQLCHARST